MFVCIHVDAFIVGESTLALAGVKSAFGRSGTGYSLSMVAEGLAGPEGPIAGGPSDGLRLQALLEFDTPWHSDTMLRTRPQPTALDLKLLEYEQNDLLLKMAGTLQIDTEGRGTGRLTLRAENWHSLVENAQENGQMNQGVAEAITEGLSLYSRLTGNGTDLDLPLDFNGGEMRVGPLPLGQGPRFRIP